MHTIRNPDTGERGITLVETLMVLGIATAFIAGSLALYNQATNASRQRDAVSVVYGVIGQVRSQYATAADYDGVDVPSGAPNSPFGDLDVIESDATGGATAPTTPTHFSVTMDDVPKTTCLSLVTTFSGDADGIDVHTEDSSGTLTVLANFPASGSVDVSCPDDDENLMVFRTN